MTCRTSDNLNAADVRALLSYDPNTGIFTWRETGSPAGCTRPDGYVCIGVAGRLYLAHRLAWLWMTGEWPALSVDHINRVKGDDRWVNLRLATAAQNVANSGARRSSGSGIKGVSWCRCTGKWRATITIDGKQRSLGRHELLEDSAAAYQAAAREVHGEFCEQVEAYAAAELGVTFYDFPER